MYDELITRLKSAALWADKGLVIAPSICIKAADAIEELTGFVREAERDRDEYRERLDKANDAIEELASFKAQITDGHFYCMRGGVLYEAKVEPPKGKVFQLPPIEFAEEGE